MSITPSYMINIPMIWDRDSSDKIYREYFSGICKSIDKFFNPNGIWMRFGSRTAKRYFLDHKKRFYNVLPERKKKGNYSTYVIYLGACEEYSSIIGDIWFTDVLHFFDNIYGLFPISDSNFSLSEINSSAKMALEDEDHGNLCFYEGSTSVINRELDKYFW